MKSSDFEINFTTDLSKLLPNQYDAMLQRSESMQKLELLEAFGDMSTNCADAAIERLNKKYPVPKSIQEMIIRGVSEAISDEHEIAEMRQAELGTPELEY